MKIPTKQECLGLFKEYKVPSNILLHTKKVAEVALFLGKELRKKGIDVNLELVSSGALVHDLMKAVSLDKLEPSKKYKLKEVTREQLEMWKELRKKHAGKHEIEVTHEVLKDDFPEFAEFILKIGSIKDVPAEESWEEKLIHYADWRVFVDDIVPLKERLDDLYKRYNHKFNENQIKNWDNKIKHQFECEKEILGLAGVKAEELGDYFN